MICCDRYLRVMAVKRNLVLSPSLALCSVNIINSGINEGHELASHSCPFVLEEVLFMYIPDSFVHL